jgi:hypothetical protein
MTVWVAACWGLVGGVCVEALELYARIRRTPKWTWRKPIPQGLTAYLISIIIRAGLSAALVAAAAASGQIISAFTAFSLGIAAPLVVEKLSRTVPLTDSSAIEQNAPPQPVSAQQHGRADAR